MVGSKACLNPILHGSDVKVTPWLIASDRPALRFQAICLSLPFVTDEKAYLNQFSVFCFSASFYGSGFANLKLQDARSTTDLSLRFRTSRPEALLVLVAGKTDYCLVMLQGGMIKVRKTVVNGVETGSAPVSAKFRFKSITVNI